MSVPINLPNPGTIRLTRGKSTFLGNITATGTQCVQFSIPEPTRDNQGFLIVVANGTPGAANTAVLEGSLDGGTSWFVMSTASTNVLALTGQLTGDTAPAFADAFIVSGMGAGALFRWGVSGANPPNVNVFALVG